jgi:hypothetical protein
LAQVLRLPRKLGTTLLTSNRPLLSIITQLPERVDALRRLLKVTGGAALSTAEGPAALLTPGSHFPHFLGRAEPRISRFAGSA